MFIDHYKISPYGSSQLLNLKGLYKKKKKSLLLLRYILLPTRRYLTITLLMINRPSGSYNAEAEILKLKQLRMPNMTSSDWFSVDNVAYLATSMENAFDKSSLLVHPGPLKLSDD